MHNGLSIYESKHCKTTILTYHAYLTLHTIVQ